jgi:hypothetical protein
MEIYSYIKKKNKLGYALVDLHNVNDSIYLSTFYKNNNGEIDEEAIINILKIDITYITYLPDEIRQNKNIAMKILSIDVYFIDYIDETHYNDKEIMQQVVSEDGMLLEYASNLLKDNHDIVHNAILNEPYAIFYASTRLRANIDIIVTSLMEEPCIFKRLNHTHKKNKRVVQLAIELDVRNMQYVHDNLIADGDFMLILIKKNLKILDHVSPILYDDENWMIKIIDIDISLLLYASKRLQNNRTFIANALSKNKNSGGINTHIENNRHKPMYTKQYISNLLNKQMCVEYIQFNKIYTDEEYHRHIFETILYEIEIIGENIAKYPFTRSKYVNNEYNCNLNLNSKLEVEDCCICCEKIKFIDMCWLSCKHHYHFNCLQKWLLKTPNCPTCRLKATHMNVDMIQGTYIEIQTSNEYLSDSETSDGESEDYYNNRDIISHYYDDSHITVSNDSEDDNDSDFLLQRLD